MSFSQDELISKLQNDIDVLQEQLSKLNPNNRFKQTKKLLDDLAWEHQRMTSSGKETLDMLYNIFGMEPIKEND